MPDVISPITTTPPTSSVPSFQVPAIEYSPSSGQVRMLMDQTRTVFLGRLPKRPGRPTLQLERFYPGGSTPPPPTLDYYSKALQSIRLIYGNDSQGDCVIASGEHGIGLWSGNDSDSGGIIVGTSQEALSEYHRIGGPGDNGLVIADALDDFVKNGLLCGGKRYKIDGWADFPSSQEWYEVVGRDFGGHRIGFNVPAEWMNNVVEGAVWRRPSNYNFVGGHDVRITGYDTVGLKVSTWGIQVTMAWEAALDQRIVDERAVELAPLWYGKDGIAANGLKVYALRSALTMVKNGQLPPWQPEPGPGPGPGPGPEPGPTAWPAYDGYLTVFGQKFQIHLTPSDQKAEYGFPIFKVLADLWQIWQDIQAKNWSALLADVEQLWRDLQETSAFGVKWLQLFADLKKLKDDVAAGASMEVLLADFRAIIADLG